MGRGPLARALIGALIVAVVGATGFFGTRLAQGAFAEDYRFHVIIGETGQGLVDGSDVAFRGVLIGKVASIELTEDLRADVELVLEPRYQIPTGATFAVIGKTLFGEKQIDVRYEGDPEEASSFIAYDETVDSPDSVVEVQDVLAALDGLLAAIDPDDLATVVDDGLGAFDGQQDSIARAIDQGARATDVFARSLEDQTPSLRDLSLVAEALGPVGGEFNRLGEVLDSGALDTLTVNQGRLQVLLRELNRFSDQLDLVLELTRPDLDRLIVQGDNVTRVFFAYRPELADLVTGIDDYTDTLGNGGQQDPGFSGLAAGFLIMLENPFAEDFCAGIPPELAAVLPACAPAGGESPPPPPIPVPDPPVSAPVLRVPGVIDAAPQPPGVGGIGDIVTGVFGDLDSLRGVGP